MSRLVIWIIWLIVIVLVAKYVYEAVLEIMQLSSNELLRVVVLGLSGGMRQRVGIGRALVMVNMKLLRRRNNFKQGWKITKI